MSQDDFLSQEDATRLWKRAAEIQAEAARQAEIEAASAAAGDLDAASDSDPSDGYALTHVRAAAVEAGIGQEFVDAALADMRTEQALPSGSGIARRFLGNPDDALTASRLINAPVAEVLRAMEAVMPEEPFGLSLRDRRGDPEAGGLLIFTIPGASISGATQPGFVGQASYADLREIYASLRPVGESSCVLTLRGPIAWAYSINAGIGSLVTGGGAGLGLGVGSGSAAVAAGVLSTAGFATAAAVVAAGLVGGGLIGGAIGAHYFLRRLYRYGLSRGEVALESVISAVAVKAEGGWGFGQRALPQGTDQDE